MPLFPDAQKERDFLGIILCFLLIIFIVVYDKAEKYFEENVSTIRSNIELNKDLYKTNKTKPLSKNPLQFNPLKYTSATSTPQYVLLSFDGSKSIEMWKETTDFARDLNASGTPLHFTYFINSIYLLSNINRNVYEGPHEKRGNSAIGFADSLRDIDDRVKSINLAIRDRHEIASHSAGHWLGGEWSVEDWGKEFTSFSNLLFNFSKNNSQYEFKESLNLNESQINGFRAPSLSINENMYKVLSERKFNYDSSEVAVHDKWPNRDSLGIWHIPISTIYFPKIGMNIIAVDYSVWVNQTAGENIFKRGTSEWNSEVIAMTDAYIKHFEQNYATTRAPIVFDNHFSTWNDGLYWEAMKGFAKNVCGRPYVRCSTFSELVDYMENNIE